MDLILHSIGLCPDSLAHVDLMDIFIYYYAEFQNIVYLIRICR